MCRADPRRLPLVPAMVKGPVHRRNVRMVLTKVFIALVATSLRLPAFSANVVVVPVGETARHPRSRGDDVWGNARKCLDSRTFDKNNHLQMDASHGHILVINLHSLPNPVRETGSSSHTLPTEPSLDGGEGPPIQRAEYLIVPHTSSRRLGSLASRLPLTT